MKNMEDMEDIEDIEDILNHIFDIIHSNEKCPTPSKCPEYNWSSDRTLIDDYILEQKEHYEEYYDFIIHKFNELKYDFISNFSNIYLQKILTEENIDILDYISNDYLFGISTKPITIQQIFIEILTDRLKQQL